MYFLHNESATKVSVLATKRFGDQTYQQLCLQNSYLFGALSLLMFSYMPTTTQHGHAQHGHAQHWRVQHVRAWRGRGKARGMDTSWPPVKVYRGPVS
jgi:hypothetical protein